MAHSSGDWVGRLRGCSPKRVTYVLCTGNFVVALFMLHAFFEPLYFDYSSSSPAPGGIGVSSNGLEGVVVQTKEELERIEDSNRLRRELLPFHLIERVKEIQEETELEINRTAALNSARQKVALELANTLRELKRSNSHSTQKGGEKMAGNARAQIPGKGTPKDLKQSNADSTQKVDMEHEIIPGRAIPSECHAEAHTDYSGAAVRWGLTHHVDSAADCCQACLDQATSATGVQKKCNIWVYCPREGGCHSPDKYTHKNHECWLKQADEPQIDFKGHYDEEYRQQHPQAPPIVPWVSGVVS